MNKTCSLDDAHLTSPGAPPSSPATSPQPPQNELTERPPTSSPSVEMPLSQPEGAEGGMGMFCWHYSGTMDISE